MSVRFQSLPDDVVPAPLTPIDEDFVDLVVTKLLGNNASLPLWSFDWQYEQHEPNSLHFDEDFFQQFIIWTKQSNIQQPLGAADDRITPPVLFYTDEDFWKNPTAPVWIINTVPNYSLLEDHFDAHQVIFSTPDEDYYQQPVAPVGTVNQYPEQWLYWQDPHEPAGSLFGQDDEDFWSNSVFPVTIPNLAPQQFSFEQHDPGALHSSVDEDFWQNPVYPITYPNLAPQQFVFEQHEAAGSLYGNYGNDDQWINWSAPQTIPNIRLDQSNFSQGEEAIDLYGAFEDDSYYPVPFPAQALLLWPQPFVGDDESGTVFQAYLDDPFVLPLPQVATEYQTLPIFFDAVETVIQIPYQGTEDYAIAQPQSLPTLQMIPFWPWSWEPSNDFRLVIIRGKTYIYWIG